jgi:hypothetical protein
MISVYRTNPSGTYDHHVPVFVIFLMKTYRYFKIGYLLHMMTLLGVCLFFFFGQLSLLALESKDWWLFALFTYLSLYGFVLPFFAQFDIRSRYQNYKLIKDKLYENNYHNLLIKPFSRSRCQRDAVLVAATDMGMHAEVSSYFYKLGYRWYHILPGLVLNEPSRLFTRDYWNKTLFVKGYRSKYFLW